MMRYSKVMLRPAAVALVCVWVCGCASARPAARSAGQLSALELAVAEDEDLGDPRPSAEQRQAARDAAAQAALDDPNTTHLDFDGEEANDAPIDMVVIPPDRSPSPSLIQDIISGPSR